MDSLHEFECYDHLLIAPFNKNGWAIDTVSWRNETIDWNSYDTVIIRSCWDYQQNPDQFLSVLHKIEQSSARLANPLNLVEWNISKTYLKELKEQDIPVVPTLWKSTFHIGHLSSYFTALGAEEIIIKPAIGANADFTFRLKRSEVKKAIPKLEEIFNDMPFLVQPFILNILDEGEYSLFYLNNSFSHAILKTPEQGDFRVQEEHGGKLQLVEPNSQLLQLGKKTMQALPGRPLYARIDFVRNGSSFLLMEVELIEPSLYFNMDPASPRRFVDAFERWRNKYN